MAGGGGGATAATQCDNPVISQRKSHGHGRLCSRWATHRKNPGRPVLVDVPGQGYKQDPNCFSGFQTQAKMALFQSLEESNCDTWIPTSEVLPLRNHPPPAWHDEPRGRGKNLLPIHPFLFCRNEPPALSEPETAHSLELEAVWADWGHSRGG